MPQIEMGIGEVAQPTEGEEIAEGEGDDDDTQDRLLMLAVGPPLKAALAGDPGGAASARSRGWRPPPQTCAPSDSGASDMPPSGMRPQTCGTCWMQRTAGRSMVTEVPVPMVLAMSKVPPWMWISSAARERPRPPTG